MDAGQAITSVHPRLGGAKAVVFPERGDLVDLSFARLLDGLFTPPTSQIPPSSLQSMLLLGSPPSFPPCFPVRSSSLHPLLLAFPPPPSLLLSSPLSCLARPVFPCRLPGPSSDLLRPVPASFTRNPTAPESPLAFVASTLAEPTLPCQFERALSFSGQLLPSSEVSQSSHSPLPLPQSG